MAVQAYDYGNKNAAAGSKLYGGAPLYGRDAYAGTISLAHARVRIGDAAETRWQRMFLYGVLVWAIPFVFSYAILWLDDFDHMSYVYTLAGITLLSAILCAAAQLRPAAFDARLDGMWAGLMWVLMKVGLDLLALRISGGDLLAWLFERAVYDLPILLVCLLLGFYYRAQHGRLAAYTQARLFRTPMDMR